MRGFIRIVEAMWDDEDEEEDRFGHLPSSDSINALRPQMAAAAQAVYDAWDQSNPDEDDLNGGGICHLIADRIASLIGDARIPCTTQSSYHEQHVYVVAQCSDGVFEIDIPYGIYETGGGFTWTKIEGVQFAPDDVVVHWLDRNPAKMSQFVEDWEDDA